MTPGQIRVMAAWGLFLALLALCGFQETRVAAAHQALAQEQAAHETTKRQAAEALAQALADARQKESGLRADMDALQQRASKESDDAKAREDALVERVRVGNLRLSVAARCPVPGGAAGGDPASAGGGGASLQRAELDPASGQRVLGVGADGDRNTRERNTCVDAYEALRARLNGAH